MTSVVLGFTSSGGRFARASAFGAWFLDSASAQTLFTCTLVGAVLPAIPPFVIDFLGGNHFDYLFGIFRWVGLLRWLLCSLARIGSSSRTESLDADKQEWGQATSVLGNHHLHPTLGGAASAHRVGAGDIGAGQPPPTPSYTQPWVAPPARTKQSCGRRTAWRQGQQTCRW